MQPLYSGQEAPMGGAAQCGSVLLLWSHIPDLLAQVLLPLLTSGEMEGISGGAAGGDGCKEVGWSFPSST